MSYATSCHLTVYHSYTCTWSNTKW